MLTSLVLIAGTILGADPSPNSTAAERDAILKEYEAQAAQVGTDASSQVRLALWCEANGLSSLRTKHLALAMFRDPGQPVARAMMGLMDYEGRWLRPEAVSAKVKSDEDLTERLARYNARRAHMGSSADDHWKLGLWCEQNDLPAEATAHLTAVTRLDPSREAAWKRLGYKRLNGRWVSTEQAVAIKAERAARPEASRYWKPLLEKWKIALTHSATRADAETALAEVTDPLAVPSIWRVFVVGDTPDRKKDEPKAVEILSRVDGIGASRALAALAVIGSTPETRRVAGESLRRRDPREYVDGMISLLRKPIEYKYYYQAIGAAGPGSTGGFILERPDRILQQFYTVDESRSAIAASRLVSDINYLATGDLRAAPINALRTGPFGGPQFNLVTAKARIDLAVRDVLDYENRASIQNARIAATAQTVVAELEAANAQILQVNDRTEQALRWVSDQDLGTDPEAWKTWWADAQGYVYERPAPMPTPMDQPKPVLTSWIHLSCFAAGTPIVGIAGQRPIEKIKVGDRILAQNTDTGALQLQPVVAVYHNKPSPTLKLAVGGQVIVTTGIHRFWKAGRGWVMARDLKPGDILRTVGGTAWVESIDSDVVQPVFNLEVAAGQSFFVGAPRVLVHDNSIANDVVAPFDAAPAK